MEPLLEPLLRCVSRRRTMRRSRRRYEFSALDVYYKPGHELYRKWVALTAPFSARDNFLVKDDRGGIQGYLKLSITLLAPGDKPVVHDDDEGDDDGPGGAVLRPLRTRARSESEHARTAFLRTANAFLAWHDGRCCCRRR